MILWTVCYYDLMKMSLWPLGLMFAWLLCGWTVAGTGFLAQASMPRLGETNRGSPKHFFFSEVQSRWGEKGLAWVRHNRTHCFPVMLSPRREGFCLSERASLAWARPISLSEAAYRFWCYCWMVHWCVACLSDLNALLKGLRDV